MKETCATPYPIVETAQTRSPLHSTKEIPRGSTIPTILSSRFSSDISLNSVPRCYLHYLFFRHTRWNTRTYGTPITFSTHFKFLFDLFLPITLSFKGYSSYILRELRYLFWKSLLFFAEALGREQGVGILLMVRTASGEIIEEYPVDYWKEEKH